jgi:hypothetical protein
MKRLPAFLVLMAAALPSASQSTPSTTLATNVEEVSFDLVARDGKGRIVRDLRPEELQVFDNGAPVKLTSLRINETSPQTPGQTRLVIFSISDASRGCRQTGVRCRRRDGADLWC